MPRYVPLELPMVISAVGSDLLALTYERPALLAVFGISKSARNLELRFPDPLVFRVLDEMLLSTEGGSGSEGHVRDHFAYRIEDTVFGTRQSPLIAQIQLPGSICSSPAPGVSM